MAKFFVGQRVRLVRVITTPSLMGVECRIVGWEEFATDGDGRWYSGWLLNVRNRLGFQVVAESDWLEPILDQHQPCETEFKESLDRLLGREVVHGR